MRTIHGVLLTAVAAACTVGLFSGCAKPPEQELAAAKTAIEAAQTLEADKYLANRYNNALKALEAAQAEIAKQDSAFVLQRKYSEAVRLLGIATSLATELKNDVAGAKQEMKSEVEAALSAAQAALKEAREDVKKAPKSKGKEALAAMAADLTAADGSLVQAAAEISAGNYWAAKNRIGEATAKMRKVSDRLSTAGAGSLM